MFLIAAGCVAGGDQLHCVLFKLVEKFTISNLYFHGTNTPLHFCCRWLWVAFSTVVHPCFYITFTKVFTSCNNKQDLKDSTEESVIQGTVKYLFPQSVIEVWRLEDNNPFLLTWYLANLRHQLTKTSDFSVFIPSMCNVVIYFFATLAFLSSSCRRVLSQRGRASDLNVPVSLYRRTKLVLIQRNFGGHLSLREEGKENKTLFFIRLLYFDTVSYILCHWIFP